MNTSQILRVLTEDANLRKNYFGVYALDKIPTKPPLPCFLVVNTDPSYAPGQHWVAIHINSYGYGEWFDSYGLSPSFYNAKFETYLKRNTTHFEYPQIQLQELSSTVCGVYCIYFLTLRAQGIPYETILSPFNDDYVQNDKVVTGYINKMYNRHIPIYNQTFLGQEAGIMADTLKSYQ